MAEAPYDNWWDAVFDGAIDPSEALGRWLDGEDADKWDPDEDPAW